MRRNREWTRTDLSSFMCIVLMLTGALVTIMIANVMIMAANPERVEISPIIPGGGGGGEGDLGLLTDPFGNVIKYPSYLEVHHDRLIIYPEQKIVHISDLEMADNAFERLVSRVEANKEREYIVLLVRPYASSLTRQLKKVIAEDRKIDIGIDLLDETTPVHVRGADTNEVAAAKT
jgi:hypothetical protein